MDNPLKNNSVQKFLSICIPTYDMRGVGHIFLQHSLEVLTSQTFRDFDVVISDYSDTDKIKKICEEFQNRLDIHYYKNFDPTGGMAANANNAIRHANGKIIKILFQDDYLNGPKSLEIIARNFDLEKDVWQVTGCEHSRDEKNLFFKHRPKYNRRIYLGKNTIGSPSVLAIKNENPLSFDPNLKWLVDCDYYRRYKDKYGGPRIVEDIVVVIRVGDHQITNNEATRELRKNEYEYVIKKYHPQKIIRVLVRILDSTLNAFFW